MAEAAIAVAEPAAPASASPAPWYQGVEGVDPEVVGHLQNRGWDKKTAQQAAIEATRAHIAAAKLVGIPHDQVLRVPKEASDEAGWKAVWTRLGKPAKPDEYDFSAIKFSDGTPLDDDFVANARAWAFNHNLPKDAAAGMVQQFAKFLDSAEVSEKAEREATINSQKAALKKNWGPNEAANMFIAQRAAAALGITPEVVAALENAAGYDKVMEMFRQIGTKIGEDKFVRSGAPGGGGPMTREQATAKIEELKSDPVWTKAYLAGDKAKQRELMALQSIVTGIALNA